MANLLIFVVRGLWKSIDDNRPVVIRRVIQGFTRLPLMLSLCVSMPLMAAEDDMLKDGVLETPAVSVINAADAINESNQETIDPQQLFKQKLDELTPLRGTDMDYVATQTELLLPIFKSMPLALQYRFVFLKGHSFALKGESDKATAFIKAEMASPPPEMLKAEYVKILALLAAIYADLDDVTQTLQILNQIVPFLGSVDDIDNEAYVYMMMVDMLSRMTRFDAALQYTDALYATLDKVTNAMRRCYISGIHANSLMNALKEDPAQRRRLMDLLIDAKKECDTAGEMEMVSSQLRSMSELYLLKDQEERAQATLDKAYRLSLDNDSTLELGFIYAALAEMAIRAEQFTLAEKHYLQALESAKNLDINRLLVDTTLGLSELYEKTQQLDKALMYRKQYGEYNAIKMQDIQGELTTFESAKLQLLEKDRQVQSLDRQQALFFAAKQINERKQTQMRLGMTLLVGGLFFLLLWTIISVMQKRRYKALAQNDPLTGIYNRSAGEELGMALYQQSRQEQRQFSLISFDIDDFKNINDCFGHATGDWVLKKIVAVIAPFIPDDAIFARMGGEEFMILLPNVNEEAAWALAEDYAATLSAINTQYSGHDFVVSVSFGVTQAILPDVKLDSLLKRASDVIAFTQHKGSDFIGKRHRDFSYGSVSI
ncbi:GGDEF domain-containing protein [Shewanella surugensis]|uniref:diguanylate cyclase n=1 Tax=Shewanella surugensis TaxID=212020 RepID=A0ABT0L806_9GAMM|nr:GGDEF domain-containing protein [Shewanella surugensis]MCL1123507.1 GGDEF domain-containing protein [Shewanella surugensis]